MPTNVLMPQLGESVVEGTISKWLKKEGERVEELEPLLEVNTDKVDTEIPAPASGVLLKVLAAEGTTVKVGQAIAVIGEAETPLSTNGHDRAEQSQISALQSSPSRRELGFISPVVARLADEFKVDLYQIKGTGLGGRITKKDVLAYIEAQKSVPAPAPQIEVPAREPVTNGGARTTAVSGPPSAVSPPSPEVIPVEGMRKLIAEHMVRSKHTSPHVTTVFEADMSRVLAHLEQNQAAFARDGVRLTLTAYFVSAIVAALRAVPIVNSQWVEEGGTARIVLKREINVGIAVALDDGLIVPVIKRADEKSLLGLAREINDLAQRARAKALKADEVQGGTFTLTNHGVSGSLFATPIINQPQTGIMGVGAVQKRVVVLENDAIAVRPMVYLTLTFDHRVLDGASGDRFMQVVKRTLEGWGQA
jgi:2-oxoglutarate dehydrogenase E2 component (dihydrolipoamide succinyltransferase)